MSQFPITKKQIKIGILGYTEGNGHPYSWSAMFNGYDKEIMEKIKEYRNDIVRKMNSLKSIKYFEHLVYNFLLLLDKQIQLHQHHTY